MSSARVVAKPMAPAATGTFAGSVIVSSGPRWFAIVTTPSAADAGRIGTSIDALSDEARARELRSIEALGVLAALTLAVGIVVSVHVRRLLAPLARVTERARAVAGPRHLLNRPGEPEEIAAGAVYLASDDAAFVTATDLLIDGGYIAFKGRIDADGRPAMI